MSNHGFNVQFILDSMKYPVRPKLRIFTGFRWGRLHTEIGSERLTWGKKEVVRSSPHNLTFTIINDRLFVGSKPIQQFYNKRDNRHRRKE